MNIIDIIILAVLAYAIFRGMRDGLIIQGLSIVGIALGIWLGVGYGDVVAKLCGITSDQAAIWGFFIVLFITTIAVAIAARLIRKVLKFVGIGLVDVILGGALSVAKFLLILSVAFTAFDLLNDSLNLVEHKQIEKSKLYRPIANLSTWITPAWDWTQDQLDIDIEKEAKKEKKKK